MDYIIIMGFIKNALGMIGDAATGGLASGVGSFVNGLFGGGGGINYHDQKKLMEKQHGYELENMDYQAKLNEEMAQRNQQRQNEYFGMTAEYNSAKNQKQRLEEAGLNPALMYGSAGSGGAGTGSTGGASGSGVGLSQAQAVGMGLQLSQIKAQTNLMNAESAKAYAEANKIKGVDTEAAKQGIKESEAKVDEIIAKIPSEKQQYYVGKAYEESLKAAKELSESLAAKTDQEKLNLKVQEHILFKEFDKLVSEIDGVNLDNDQKIIIKNSLQKSINSQIYLNTMKAMEAAANAKFTNENMKTIQGQLDLWAAQAENWKGQRENILKQIEAQIEQWNKENKFTEKKLNLEETRLIADIILRSLEAVQKIGQIVGTAMIK
nr:MAG TPA: DNA pilot protein VP2 [Microviridae sp.]